MDNCPACGSTLIFSKDLPHEEPGDNYRFVCRRCGDFILTGSSNACIRKQLGGNPKNSQVLSHTIRKMRDSRERVVIDSHLLDDILKNSRPPTPNEQLENFILALGRLTNPRQTLQPEEDWIARLGAHDWAGVAFIIEEAHEANLITTGRKGGTPVLSASAGSNAKPAFMPISLTLKGWNLYGELLRGYSESRTSFIAMKFGDDLLNSIVTNFVSPAVNATGFELLNLQESEKAGLIDDRIRVEIRRARFLLADLTHHSNGAYWEAGFAEGLGKPVIYLCRRDVFNDQNNTTHFDTNHHLTIDWDATTIGNDMEHLKATIRATLPSEAKLES